MRYVDIGIPANKKESTVLGVCSAFGKNGFANVRTIRPGYKWDVMMDLFFYREPEEAKQVEEEEQVAAPIEYGALGPEYSLNLSGDQWPAQIADAQWPGEVQNPISAAPQVAYPTEAPLVAEGWDAVPAPPVAAIPEAGIPTPQPTGWE